MSAPFYRHAPGTIWRRALARVDRRKGGDPLLLAEACRLANRIYLLCVARP